MEKNIKQIVRCRVCDNSSLILVLDLGSQYISGVFPRSQIDASEKAPLRLVKCDETNDGCGHVQLEHTYDLNKLYGMNYGYRSGLNSSMVDHLKGKAERIQKIIDFDPNDIVLDIAGNDGTFLGFFPKNLRLLSIDPTSAKFHRFYPDHVTYVSNFFSSAVYRANIGHENAKLVTSFSMFYDLENPCGFAKEIHEIIHPQGIWVLEQSYLPNMLNTNSFDTICHEHLSYFSLRQIKYIMDKSDFKIVDIEFNAINGGSISLSVTPKANMLFEECIGQIQDILLTERNMLLDTLIPWRNFQSRINSCKIRFYEKLQSYKELGYRICALGASTKGNITLQTWNLNREHIEVIGDVNPDKDGCMTPGSWIPITSEDKVLESNYDVYIILPWHFKPFFLENKKFKGLRLYFPLPEPEEIVPL